MRRGIRVARRAFMPRFLPRFLPCAGLVAGALSLTTTSPAKAASNDGAEVIALIALFDAISLPADIYMAVKHERVPKEWAYAEMIGGGLQMTAGGIGIGYCVDDAKCKNGAGLPALIGFTAWTTAMMFHGVFSITSQSRGIAAITQKPAPFSLVPIVGDGRTTPAGVGLVGRF